MWDKPSFTNTIIIHAHAKFQSKIMMKVSRHSSDHFQLSEKCDYIDLVNINVYAKFYGNISNGLEVGPVSLFQNLDLGKASTNDKMSFGNPLGYILSISMYAKYYAQFKIKSQFHFSRILTSVKARPMRNDIWQYLGLQFVNTNVCVKNKNIPHGPRDRASITFSEFGPLQRLDQRQMALGNLLG